MQLELSDNFKGKCLIAMPSIKNDMFRDSVIYITEHSTVGGAVGVIVNKNLSDGKSNPLTDFSFDNYGKKWRNIPLYLGGPVELSSGFVLYSDVKNNDLLLTGNRQQIHQIVTEVNIEPIMLTAGYCMWETLQLEREVKFNNWLVVDNIVAHLVNKIEPAERYHEALKIAGVNNIAHFDCGGGNA